MTRHRGKWISYLRVSTKRQGESGLGVEAQRSAVEAFLNGGNWQLVEEHVEVESGKHDHNRPALHKALEACKLYNATLVIAKIDRLSPAGEVQATPNEVCFEESSGQHLLVSSLSHFDPQQTCSRLQN